MTLRELLVAAGEDVEDILDTPIGQRVGRWANVGVDAKVVAGEIGEIAQARIEILLGSLPMTFDFAQVKPGK